jgi:hypothetical protein
MIKFTQTHLSQIDGIYQFRRCIAKDLLAVYVPKLEIKFSFKTKDKRKAEQQLTRIESVKIDQELETYRRQLAKPQEPQVLSNEDLNSISQQIAYEVLAENDQQNFLVIWTLNLILKTWTWLTGKQKKRTQ